MAWTAPKDWSVGEVATAANLNTHIRDNLKYLKGTDGAVTIDNDLTAKLAAGGTLIAEGTNAGSFARFKLLCKKTAGSATVDWRIFANALSDAGEFSIYDAVAAAERLRIDSSGNVGIGSASPAGKLHVKGATGGTIEYEYSGLGASTITLLSAGAITAGLYASYVTKPSSGSITSTAAGLTTAGTSIDLFSDGGSNIFRLNYVADGSLTLTRAAGTRTYSGTIKIVYY